ncbi:MAG: hypothetical protein EA393_00005 [Bacteroidetes bacterium]|nr:MAG: hypothetical protein EA393_00005 [Bacteroidota bacterium]
MKEIRVFEPALKFPFPRGLEIVMRMLFFVAILFFIDYIGLLREPGIDYKDIKKLLLLGFMLATTFYIYKLMVNRTVTNKVIINYSERTFTVHYSFFYFISKKRKIHFEDISFWIDYLQTTYFGNAIAAFIYENDKFRLKINARNGWKKKQVEEIIEELLVITDGKMRRTPKGIPDE